jgi:hypothetical protein
LCSVGYQMINIEVQKLASNNAIRLIKGECTVEEAISVVKQLDQPSQSALYAVELVSHIPDSVEREVRAWLVNN